MTELLLGWLDPFPTVEEQDRLLGWHLDYASKPQPLQCFCSPVTNVTGTFDTGQQLDR